MPPKKKEFEFEYHRRLPKMAGILSKLSDFKSLPADEDTKANIHFAKLLGEFTELIILNEEEDHAINGVPGTKLPAITKAKVDKWMKLTKYDISEIDPEVLTHFKSDVLRSIPDTIKYLKAETKRKELGQLKGYATAAAQRLDKTEAAAEAKAKKEAKAAKAAAKAKRPVLSRGDEAIDLRLYDLQMAKAGRIHSFIKEFFDKWSTTNKECKLDSGPEDQKVDCDERKSRARSRSQTGSKESKHAFECLLYPCTHGDQNPDEEEKGSTCDDQKKGTKRKKGAAEPKCRKPSAKGLLRFQHPRAEQGAVGRRFVEQRALLLAWKAGSGKSLAAVIAAECALEEARRTRKTIPKVVVLTKKSLLTNFAKNIKRYGRDCAWIDEHYRFFAIEWLTKPPKGQISLEQLRSECHNGIVIIDESHELRHPAEGDEGKRAAEALDLVDSASKVLLMTGTPLVNEISDLYNTALMFTKSKSKDRKEFDQAFPYPESMDNYPDYSEAQRAALNKVFNCKVSTIESGNPPAGFPSSLETNVLIQMEPKFQKAYESVEKSLESKEITEKEMAKIKRGALEANTQNKAAFHSQLRQAVNAGKIQYIVDKALANKKLCRTMVVHSQFIGAGLDEIRKALADEGILVDEISGKESSAIARDCAVEKLNSRKIDVLLISEAGATGIDLKGVSVMINLEAFWNESEREQANARVVRYLSHANLPDVSQLPKGCKPIPTNVILYNLYLAKKEDMEKYYIRMQSDADAEKPGAAFDVSLFGVTNKRKAEIRAKYAKEAKRKSPSSKSSPKRKSPEAKSADRDFKGEQIVNYATQKAIPSSALNKRLSPSPPKSPRKQVPKPRSPAKVADPLANASSWEL
jgi:hypothetical protein